MVSKSWRMAASATTLLGLLLASYLCVAGNLGTKGGTIKYACNSAYSIAIPDSFIVTDIDEGWGRLFVIASVEQCGANGQGGRLSELWHFTHFDSRLPAVTFEDRNTLLSFRSTPGKVGQTCVKVVSCKYAAAVHIQGGMGSESTVIFDNYGTRTDLPVDDIAKACACDPNIIVPIMWLALGQGRKEDRRLLCSVGAEGGLHTFAMLYNPASGEVELAPAREVMGELGDAMLRYYSWAD